MKHDPFYGKIIERLNGQLDPNTFEACVVDLLRTQDGLFAVPIPGGSDSGMDGAVADFEGEPFPVVTTTAKDVIGNLRKNLDRYKADGGSKRTCIVATSQKLTQERLDNLTDRAAKRGFTLIQRLEQSAIASRLYHASYWCKELLHLTGKPSALSVIPVTHRPLPGFELIGRTEARDWLRNSDGDRLLVGEPGAGKTSLLHEFAIDEENRALFVVSHDEGEIANAVRDQEPKVLIVDDAHADINFLTKLKQLRQEISADFDILATSWKGDGPEIAHKLYATPEKVHELKRLTQDEIAEIAINAGITGNHWLVNEIVRQAAGLPGLAGTLAYFALQGRWREIYTGEALATDITTFYKNRVSGDVAGLLACFALGGNSGMGKDTVSKTINMPILQLRQDLSNLAHGGIIAEVPIRKDFIKVRPSALRHALIRDIFFSGPDTLPETCLQDLIAAAPDDVDTVRELIDVRRRWGNVPPNLIQKHLKEFIAEMMRWIPILPSSPLGYSTPSLKAVREYAWLGSEEANWVTDNFTANLSNVARPLLQNVPERVIPCLLTEAIGDNRPLNSNTEHPLRLLQDWIKQAHPGTAEPLQRRAKILHATKTWLSGGHDTAIGYSAMLLAVLPHFDFSENQPGIDGSIRIYSGFLIHEHLVKLQEYWEEIIECARVYTASNWEEFLSTVGSWAYPYHGNGPDENTRKMMTDFAQRMAFDVAEVASEHVGVLHRLKALMDRSYPDFEIVTDDAIEILYPIERLENDWEKQESNWKEDADKLADQWALRKPIEVVAQIEHIESEISKAGKSWPRLTPHLCCRLAEKTSDPLRWFEAMLPTTLPVDTVFPFLLEAVEQNIAGWEHALESAFDTARLKASAMSIILTKDDVTMNLKLNAMRDAAQFPNLIEQLVRSNRLSKAVTVELYEHADKSLASKVALSQWKQNDSGGIPSWIRSQWEEAIINHAAADYQGEDFQLGEIFASEPSLGKKWLVQNFKDDSFEPFKFEKSIDSVIASLTGPSRQELLELIPEGYRWRSTAAALVGDSPELFEKLLSLPRNELDVLAPLSRSMIDSVWMAFAKLAFQHGHSEASIASCAFTNSSTWSGRYSDIVKSQYKQFERFCSDNDEIVRRIANAGNEYFSQQYEYWRKRERDEDVFGRD